MNTTRQRIKWQPVLAEAADWVNTLDITPTLRQVFYHLVATRKIPNDRSAYNRLSDGTAVGRREGWFPDLEDGTRGIVQPTTYTDLADLTESAARAFRLDRWAVQDTLVVLAVEKRGMLPMFQHWFGAFGFPMFAVAGYASQTLVNDVAALVEDDGRDAVLLYGGDYDASGLDIFRDLVERTDCWWDARRVTLTAEQVIDYSLPVNPGKASDSRSGKFAEVNGNVQVEVDALDPDDLRSLFADALAPFVDLSKFNAVIAQEKALRAEFRTRMP